MKPRTRARVLALQVLYEVDVANHPPGEVFKARLEESPLSPELSEFARQIIFGILPMAEDLDTSIAKYAPEWPFDQIHAIGNGREDRQQALADGAGLARQVDDQRFTTNAGDLA